MSADISVNRSSLSNMAAFWSESSSQVTGWGTQISSSTWRNSPGIFGTVIGPYNEVCEKYAQLCSQGGAQMTAITDALVKAGGNYASVEEENSRLSDQIIGDVSTKVTGR
jgi:hypothetical protein